MLGGGGLDIYHLSFYVCRSAGAAESKLVRVIADTAREELPGYDVLPVSTSRAVFTGRDRPSRRVTLLNLPHNFFLFPAACFLLEKEKLLTPGDRQRGLVTEKLLWFTQTMRVLSELHSLEGLNLYRFF